MIVMLHERIDYEPHLKDGFGKTSSHASIFPGLCDADTLRREIGDPLYSSGIRLGVITVVEA